MAVLTDVLLVLGFLDIINTSLMIPLKATFALDHISRSFVHAVTVYRTIMLLAKNIGESTSS